MTKPIRVQLSRQKGWRMPPNTVKVDRTTKWGNPFEGERGLVVWMFRRQLERERAWFPIPVNRWPRGKIPASMTTLADVQKELRGKNLACWCPLDQPCHADVLLAIANS